MKLTGLVRVVLEPQAIPFYHRSVDLLL